MGKEIRGVIYIKEWDMKELMKDKNYYRMEVAEPQHKGFAGIYLTPYCRLEVVVENQCTTCANYKAIPPC